MQYGAELFPYRRVEKAPKESNSHKKINIIRILTSVFYFIASLLISRVILVNYMAPFGIAFLIAIVMDKRRFLGLISGGGMLLGYASLEESLSKSQYYEGISIYFIVIVSIVVLGYILNGRLNKYKKVALLISVTYIEFSLYKLFYGLTPSICFLTSFFEVGCIIPVYFISNHSLICLQEIKTRHLFSSEEIISMAITASLVVTGAWGISFYGISVRNVIALTAIVILGFVKGAEVGSAIGVALGTIVGITSNNIIAYIAVFGLCGLISGVFYETGKLWSGISFIIAFSIIKLYSNLGSVFNIAEALVSLLVFLIISQNIYKRLEIDLDFKNVHFDLKDSYANKIKNILMGKVDNFSEVLLNVSQVLDKLAENEKLEMRNKSACMVENLADRVCSSCTMNSMCWKRESFYTYNAFTELIGNFQDKNRTVPYEIDRKCIKRSELLKNTEEIVNNFILNEIWKAKSLECRKLLAGQISSMADSVNHIVTDISSNIRFDKEIENDIRRVLRKVNIPYSDVVCFNDRNNRLTIQLAMQACGGKQVCIKRILPLLNEVTGKCMCVGDDGCNLDINTGNCSIIFEETPKYHVATYMSKVCKENEEYSGDSCSYGKLSDGTYMVVLSDGMGSGPRAEQESGATVDLIKRFSKAGFDRVNAISTVNSILSLRFSDEEKFSTVDLNSIDLYTGRANFIKVGSAASFIKRENRVDVINSKTLPMGVLDKLDIEVIDKNVGNGDMIIMMSDGVLDLDNNSLGNTEWVFQYLQDTNCSDPKELSVKLLERAKELSSGRIKDDMTIAVSKVYSLY